MRKKKIGKIIKLAKKIGGYEMLIRESGGGKKAFESTIFVRHLYRELNRLLEEIG